MRQPFNRRQLQNSQYDILARGRWGNADIYLLPDAGNFWVIKDFMPCPPLIQKTWGRFMVKREYQALVKLQGLPGIPEQPFMLDAFALCYRFIPGGILKDASPESIPNDFFFNLEKLIQSLHARNLVHLDVRNQRNILVMESGNPALLDFQSSLNLEKIPRFLHQLLKDIDMSGVYKNWNRKKPETLDVYRKNHLESLNRKRFLWFLKGYPLGTKKNKRS